MTIDQLIALVDRRDELSAELSATRSELARQNVQDGIYIGSDGRVVKVIEHADHPRDFVFLNVRTELRWR